MPTLLSTFFGKTQNFPFIFYKGIYKGPTPDSTRLFWTEMLSLHKLMYKIIIFAEIIKGIQNSSISLCFNMIQFYKSRLIRSLRVGAYKNTFDKTLKKSHVLHFNTSSK